MGEQWLLQHQMRMRMINPWQRMDSWEMKDQSQSCQGAIHAPHIALQMYGHQCRQQPNMLQEYGSSYHGY